MLLKTFLTTCNFRSFQIFGIIYFQVPTFYCSILQPRYLSCTSSIKAVDELSFLWPTSVSVQAQIFINNLGGPNNVNNPLSSSNCTQQIIRTKTFIYWRQVIVIDEFHPSFGSHPSMMEGFVMCSVKKSINKNFCIIC